MTERVIPDTIDKTGKNEAVVALNAWRKANVRTGDKVIWPDYGRFRCDKVPLALGDMQGVEDEGNGSQIVRVTDRPWPTTPAEDAAHSENHKRNRTLSNIDLSRATSGVARHLYAVGANDDVAQTGEPTEAQHGWNFNGTWDYELDHCGSTRTWGDPHYFGSDESFSKRNCERIYIHDGVFTAAGRQGLGISSVNGLAYRFNRLAWVMRTLIDYEPNSANKVIDDIEITDCQLGAHKLTFWSSGGGDEGIAAKVGRTLFARNTVISGLAMMLLTGGDAHHKRGPYIIRDNVGVDGLVGFGSPTGALIVVRNANGLVVIDNHGLPVQAGRGMVGILAAPDVPVVYSGNDFPGAVAEFKRAA